MSKVYEFHDVFVKTCEYKDGVGNCKKRRESKKCVDGVCEKVAIPNNKLEVLEDYYKQVQEGSGKETLKCDHCNKLYTTTSGLKYHKLKHDTKSFKCPEKGCYYKTSKFDKFKKHVDKHHGKSEPVLSDSFLESKSNNLEELDKQWFEMQSKFQEGSGNTPAMRRVVHSLKKKYRCTICKKYKYKETKAEHMAKHERFRCPICSEYKTRFTIQEHMEEHKNEENKTGAGSPQPINKALYNYVKQLAKKKFKSKSGIYRSSWIVKEYKKRGGRYSGKKSSSSGLKRWYKEKWVDLNRPIRNSKGKIIGYKSCGRKSVKGSRDKYPLCRPSKRVNRGTPRTYHSISTKSIKKAKREKSRIKHKGNIKFGSGSQEGGYYGDPKLKKQLLRNLLLKKTCPICLKIVKDDMLEHLHKHESELPPKKRRLSLEYAINQVKKQKGGSDCEMCQLGSGKTRSQYHGRRSKVMIKVPSNVKNVALYSFKLKKMGFGGGIETGWKRAKQLATRDSIPIEDLKYMRAWFARHLYASYPSYKQWKKAGRPKDTKWHKKHGIISWLIWSGDAGFKWVNSQKNINLLNKHYNKSYKPLKLK